MPHGKSHKDNPDTSCGENTSLPQGLVSVVIALVPEGAYVLFEPAVYEWKIIVVCRADGVKPPRRIYRESGLSRNIIRM
jgi:hypothetical protein